MGEEQIPLEVFFGEDILDLPFRIYEMKPRLTPSPLDPHRHDFYEIFIFEKGSGNHYIDFKEYAVKPATLHFVAPGQVHWVKRSMDSSGFMIAFSRTFFSPSDRVDAILGDLPFFHSEYSPVLALTLDAYQRVAGICNQLLEEMKGNLKGKGEILRAYFKILLIECRRYLEHEIIHSSHQSHQNIQLDFIRFKKAVEEHFNKNQQVKDYTRLIGCSHQKLNEIVKRATGQTALEYIHNRILLEAKRLLFFSENSIKETAYALNFDDPSNFSKFFRSKTGMSPLQFKTINNEPGLI